MRRNRFLKSEVSAGVATSTTTPRAGRNVWWHIYRRIIWILWPGRNSEITLRVQALRISANSSSWLKWIPRPVVHV